MKIIHLSDLHLGKRVNEFPMIEDQEYILKEIIGIIDAENPDAVLVAGDVYDKSVPSEEAVTLWDEFLSSLAKRHIEVFAISGNHDSAVRFAGLGRLVEGAGIHLSPVYKGKISTYEMEDEYGVVKIHLLPFIKPANVRGFFPEEEINDYTDAVRVALSHPGGAAENKQSDEADKSEETIDKDLRNILVAHQFVTGAERCESEEITIGGLDNVDASVFDDYDYVALGHIHGPQMVKRETVRYSGTPLKYSFSEKDHHKSVTIVELKEKGNIEIRKTELKPKHDLRQIKGTYEELTNRRNYEGTDTEDYIHAVLTDEEDIPDAMGKLRVIYRNLMKLSYDNKRTRTTQNIDKSAAVDDKSPLELFEEFYEIQNNSPMSEEQKELVKGLIEGIWN